MHMHAHRHRHTYTDIHVRVHTHTNYTHTLTAECLGGGRLGFFNLATAAACELMAFIKPELSVMPVATVCEKSYSSYYGNKLTIL